MFIFKFICCYWVVVAMYDVLRTVYAYMMRLAVQRSRTARTWENAKPAQGVVVVSKSEPSTPRTKFRLIQLDDSDCGAESSAPRTEFRLIQLDDGGFAQ